MSSISFGKWILLDVSAQLTNFTVWALESIIELDRYEDGRLKARVSYENFGILFSNIAIGYPLRITGVPTQTFDMSWCKGEVWIDLSVPYINKDLLGLNVTGMMTQLGPQGGDCFEYYGWTNLKMLKIVGSKIRGSSAILNNISQVQHLFIGCKYGNTISSCLSLLVRRNALLTVTICNKLSSKYWTLFQNEHLDEYNDPYLIMTEPFNAKSVKVMRTFKSVVDRMPNSTISMNKAYEEMFRFDYKEDSIPVRVTFH